MATFKIENPLPLQEICQKFAFKLFIELKVSKLDFGKNGELSLKPKIQEIFRYFKCLPKPLLQVLLTEFQQSIYGRCFDTRRFSYFFCSENYHNLLFLLFGLPVPVECDLILLSTPVVNFVERYSQNVSCLTLNLDGVNECVKEMRNIFFVLKNVEELVIITPVHTILHFFTVICNCEILPALKSLSIISSNCRPDYTIIDKSLKLLSVRKFNEFEIKFRNNYTLHIVFYEDGIDIQKLKLYSDEFWNELTEVLTFIKNNCSNISSLDLGFKDLECFQVFDSLYKLKSLKLVSTWLPFCFQECLEILKKYPQLEILHLRNCIDVNFDDLVNFNNQLKELVFTDCKFKLDMLSTNHFIQLKHLKIADCIISEALMDEIINVASSSPKIQKLKICSFSNFIFSSGHLSGFHMPIDKFIFNNLPVATLNNIEELSFCVCTCTATVLKKFLSFFKRLKILKIVYLIVPIDQIELVMEYFSNSSVLVKVFVLLDKEEAKMIKY